MLISNTRSYLTSEAAIASEAAKTDTMHIDARVTEVADFKFNVISDLIGC